MKKLLLLSIIALSLYSCQRDSSSQYTFMGQDAREVKVWRQMVDQDRIHFDSVKMAYRIYKSHNEIDRLDRVFFEKWERSVEMRIDNKGYVVPNSQLLAGLAVPSPNSAAMSSNFTPATTNFSNEGNWVNIGPFGNPDLGWSATGNGALQEVIFHPTDNQIWYAPSRNGGLWKTTNGGKNWTPTTDYMTNPHLFCGAISESQPETLYIGFKSGEIMRSDDGGETWVDRSTGYAGHAYKIIVHPTDPDKVMVAHNIGGLAYSTDGGVTWNVEAGRTENVVRNSDGSRAYFFDRVDATGMAKPEIKISTDWGTTWTKHTVTTDYTAVHNMHIALSEDSSGADIYVYALADPSVSNLTTRFKGLFKSTNNGASFTEIKSNTYTYPNGRVALGRDATGAIKELQDNYGGVNPFISTWYGSDFWVSDNNENWMLTTAVKMWISLDGGVEWEFAPSYGNSMWADFRDVRYNATKDSIFLINDGGVYAIKETDLFKDPATLPAGTDMLQWRSQKVVPKNGDICVAEGTNLSLSTYNKDVFISGGQDLGQIFQRDGVQTHVSSGDVYRGSIKPDDDKIFFAGHPKVMIDNKERRLYDQLVTDHSNPNRIYGFLRTTTVDPVAFVRSKDGVMAWEVNGFLDETYANPSQPANQSIHNNGWEKVSLSGTTITDPTPYTFEQSRADHNLAFIGDEENGNLFKTTNLSAAAPVWTQIQNAPSLERYRIATHPANKDMIALADTKAVYMSYNGGNSWNLLGNFPGSAPHSILFDKNTTEGLYVATSTTVYYKDETLTDWIEFNKNLPYQQVRTLRLMHYKNGDDIVYVNKYGRGVWRSSTYRKLKEGNPVASFATKGREDTTLELGESVNLINLSSNYDTVSWTITNGSSTTNYGDVDSIEFTPAAVGRYDVTITATNSNGSDSNTIQNYIYVVSDNYCSTAGIGTLWWQSTKDIEFLNTMPFTPSLDAHQYYPEFVDVLENTAYPFSAVLFQSTISFQLNAYADFNRDGDFDDPGEELMDSNGVHSASYSDTITIPDNTASGDYYVFRLVSRVNGNPYGPCPIDGNFQVVDYRVRISGLKITNPSHVLVDESTANLSTTYTGALNPFDRGFVLSHTNPTPTIENSDKYPETGTMTSNGTIAVTLSDLDVNHSYYYRPYVQDDTGIFYGDTAQFTLAPYQVLAAAPTEIRNLGENDYEVRASVYPYNHVVQEVAIQYGINEAFDNEKIIDLSPYNITQKFDIETILLNLSDTDDTQFRVRVRYNNEDYFSSFMTNDTDATLCTATTTGIRWYAKIKKITLDGTDLYVDNTCCTQTDSDGYKDETSTIVDIEKGKPVSYTITDSFDNNGVIEWYSREFLIYIDLNNNKKFEPSELVVNDPKGDSTTGTFTITGDIIADNVVDMWIMNADVAQSELPCTYVGQAVHIKARLKEAHDSFVYDNGWMAPLGSPVGVATSTDEIEVKNGTAVLDQATTAASITVDAGATLQITDELTISRNILNEGTIDAMQGTLTMVSFKEQSITGAGTTQVSQLKIDKELSTATVSQQMDIYDELNMVAGTLDANSNITLKSDATHTAIVSEITSGAAVEGDFTVERFVPRTGSDTGRAFRFLSSPVIGSSIFANWQEDGNTMAGLGTHITGAAGPSGSHDTTTGFDYTITGNKSLFTYSNNTNQQWVEIDNTITNTLADVEAYRLFIRGDRTLDMTVPTNQFDGNSTTLRATGELRTGAIDKTYDVEENDFVMIANPYQAPLDMHELLTASDNINSSMVYYYDPTLGGLTGRGSYSTVVGFDNLNLGTSVPSASGNNKYLQPGQAVFVRASAGANGPSNDVVVRYRENQKAGSSELAANTVFSAPTVNMAQIKLSLYDQASFMAGNTLSDELLITFDATQSNTVDGFDIEKLYNIDESIAISQQNTDYVIASRAIPTAGESIDLSFYRYRAANYNMIVQVDQLYGVNAVLVDQHLNTRTVLNDGSNNISFSVDQNIPGSIATDRFSIEFENSTLSNDTVALKQISLYPNPASGSFVTLRNPGAPLDLSIIDLSGKVVYTTSTTGMETQLDIENLSAGMYLVKATDGDRSKMLKLIID